MIILMNRRKFCRQIGTLSVSALSLSASASAALPQSLTKDKIYINNSRWDLLVYGGTPGGIMTAVAAARQGLRVLLAEPTKRVGGLLSNGISHTDFRTYESLTGLYAEFCDRIMAYYENKYGKTEDWYKVTMRGTHAEPHVNQLVLEQMLTQAGVQVITFAELQSVKVGGRNIRNAVFDVRGKRQTYTAQYFADATYEGDLLAMAGVAYSIGREAQSRFGETLAPLFANKQLQAYNFRLTMTQERDNMAPVPKPEGYRREDFADILPLLHDGRIKRVFGLTTDCIYKNQPFYNPLPNRKFDINDVSNGPVRMSLPGENAAWPEGNKAQRQAVFKRHLYYNVGLLWFLQHDEAVPSHIREEALSWGFCKDEFPEDNHLPDQLYVREARRMQGRYIFTQNDTNRAHGDARCIFHPESIAIGDYGPNCHGTAHEGPFYGGKHIGEYYLHTPPYQIPYGVLLPKEIDNLIVPVACSSSQIGFCAIRYEPIWCALGHAAGLAVAQSLQSGKPLADIDIKTLQRTLHRQRSATIYVSDVPPEHEAFAAVQWIGSLGGLHHLAPPPPDNGEFHRGIYGKNLESQYFAAFPGHFFEPSQPTDQRLLDLWKPLLPPQAAAAWQEIARQPEAFTRAKAAVKLFQTIL